MVSLADIDAMSLEDMGFRPDFTISSADQIFVSASIQQAVAAEYDAMCHEVDALALREVLANRRRKKGEETTESMFLKVLAPELMRGITADIPVGAGVLHVKNGIIIGWE